MKEQIMITLSGTGHDGSEVVTIQEAITHIHEVQSQLCFLLLIVFIMIIIK